MEIYRGKPSASVTLCHFNTIIKLCIKLLPVGFN